MVRSVCKTVSVRVGRLTAGKPAQARLVDRSGTTIGRANLKVGHDHVEVQLIEVDEPSCGYGTKLYEGIAEAACASGRTVRSDCSRTEMSEGFWEKQLRKGRAVCRGKGGTRIDIDEYGAWGPSGESWDCRQYELQCGAAIQEGRADLAELGRIAPHKQLVSPAVAKRRVEERHPGTDLSTLPPHIHTYAEYMRRVSSRGPSARDIVKAYVITRSSVQRQARSIPTMCETYPGWAAMPRIDKDADVRPEDAMSALLFTPMGQRYLDAAERGVVDEEAIDALASRHRCFGYVDPREDNPMPKDPKKRARWWASQKNFLRQDMRRAAHIAARADEAQRALTLPPDQYWAWVKENLPGIGPAKAGFFASLLGRGDIPTFDAREINLWQQHRGKKALAPKWADVKKLKARLDKFPMQLPPEYEPFRAHLVHHALWDSYPAKGEPTETTHEAVVDAMQLAGRGFPRNRRRARRRR